MNATLSRPLSAGVSMCRSSLENVAYEFVFTSSALLSKTCSSDLDGLPDGRKVTVQLLYSAFLSSFHLVFFF